MAHQKWITLHNWTTSLIFPAPVLAVPQDVYEFCDPCARLFRLAAGSERDVAQTRCEGTFELFSCGKIQIGALEQLSKS